MSDVHYYDNTPAAPRYIGNEASLNRVGEAKPVTMDEIVATGRRLVELEDSLNRPLPVPAPDNVDARVEINVKRTLLNLVNNDFYCKIERYYRETYGN